MTKETCSKCGTEIEYTDTIATGVIDRLECHGKKVGTIDHVSDVVLCAACEDEFYGGPGDPDE